MALYDDSVRRLPKTIAMRNCYLSLLLVLLGLSLSAQTAIEVPNVQRPLITKRTADWCPLCGGWGWTFYKALIEQNDADAVILSAHFSGGLMSSTAASLTANLGGGYQPVFYFNQNDLGVTSTNYQGMLTATRTRVELALKDAPVAQTGIRATYGGDSLRIATLTRFFKPADGDYFLGVYLVEKSVIAPQSQQGPQADHRYLLRTALTPEWQGRALASGAIAAGKEVSHNFSFPLGSYRPENLQIATVIWRKNGSKFEVVNANEANEVSRATTAVADLSGRGYRWTAGPNPLQADLQLLTDFPEPLASAKLELLTLSGQVVAELFQGNWPAGRQQHTFQRPAYLSAGLYLLRLHSPRGQLSQSIVIP